MNTLLLIGGTGFFGKSFLDCFNRGLLKQWDIERVIAMSRNAYRLKVDVPELITHQVELINADICNLDSIPFADYVVHAAATTDAKNYISKPEIEKKNIQAGTANYCELAKKFHRGSRIVYCSSGAIYGNQPKDLQKITEEYSTDDLDQMPSTKRDYAAAKRDAEKSIQELAEMGGAVSIARCFAFVGKYLPRDQHFAIGNFIQDGLMNRPIVVNATSPVYRSYMHADDLINWLMTIVDNASQDCDCFNVGSDEAISMIDLSTMIANEFGVVPFIPKQIDAYPDRYIPSIEKARDKLGLTLTINLKNAIQSTIESIRG